jgi:Protein of unknown function (DUF4235)
MRILYKPFSIISGIIGAKLGRGIFKTLWRRVDREEPPRPTTHDASFPKVVGAAALAGVAAVVDRASARAFHHLTGIWPGEPVSEDKQDD